eukprot:3936020-Rhodomonas_salina.3
MPTCQRLQAKSKKESPVKRKAASISTPGSAPVYFSDLQNIIAALFSAQQKPAGTAPPGQRPPAGEENSNEKKLCPWCKINHPGGLQTCPHLEETKKIMAEKTEKFQSVLKKFKEGTKGKINKKPGDQLPGTAAEEARVFLAETIKPSE